ncbi:MAG: PEP-CTERM sorting domain-containing protein [Phycisphaerae bacterium]|nr:PEP-CTERM sorting domain-containing protein [Phycisphaerae bacterium]
MVCANGFRRFLTVSTCILAVGSTTALAARTALSVTATNANGTGTFVVTLPEGDGGFVWRLTNPVPIVDSNTGAVIADLQGASVAVNYDTVAERGGMSPEVNLGFAVQAGVSNTAFMITSALVPVGPFTSAEGRASAAYTVTDLTGNGVTLDGDGPTGGGYLAQYNGFVPVGSTFTEGINSLTAAGAFGSNSTSLNTPGAGFLPIPGTVSDMSSMIAFTLTAGDFASGTTNYQIVPEPATCGLLALAALAIVRRR